MPTSNRIYRLFSYALFAAMIPPASSVAAEETPVTAETVAVRIDLAGRQRMLAERMNKFFCFARSNVRVAESVEGLKAAIALFDATHEGFAKGDPKVALFPEQDSSSKRSLQQVDLLWGPLKGIYDTALAGTFVDEDKYQSAVGLTLEVRSRANDYVAQLRAAYADELGARGFGDAVLLDLYGRQRMLSQKLSKEVCLVSLGYALDEMRPELEATLNLFETSLNAFIEGLPIAGVQKPPTPEIEAQLRLAKSLWTEVRPTAATVAGGGAASLNDLGIFAATMDEFLVEMNKAVKMLAKLKAGPEG